MGKQDEYNKPGFYKGRHYSTYLQDIDALKKAGNYPELESLLIELVNATEAESKANIVGAAPHYYSELAIIYRKQKEYSKEVSILERFAKQKHAPGVMPARLLERLKKLKQLQKNA